jgi:quercetin dioxygenase-like cupin family protein
MPITKEMEPKAHVHPGFEFLYVVKGELELRHGEQACRLEEGDAVYFDSNVPHSYQCVGKKPAGAVIVTMFQETAAPMRAAATRTAPGTPNPEQASERDG